MSIENYIVDCIRGKRRGICAALLLALLRPLSWGYAVITHLRNFLYDRQFFRQERVGVPVISVGNIVAGGTGKTPVTIALAEQLSREKTVAVISRGYRSPAERADSPVALSLGEGPRFPASECGDEPFLIAQRLPHLLVFVGSDRLRAAQMAVEAGAELIILDDGMQHRRLYRDQEIVVVDGNDPLGQGAFLPRGFLRDSPYSLRRADCLVLNHSGPYSAVVSDALEALLNRYTTAPMQWTHSYFDAFYTLDHQPLDIPPDTKIGVFCGIANPSKFFSLINDRKLEISHSLCLPDHCSPTGEELVRFSSEARSMGARYLICTEKDSVKLQDYFRELPSELLPILYCRISNSFKFCF